MNLKIRRVNIPPKDLLERRWPKSKQVLSRKIQERIKYIIKIVKEQGDSALIEFTKRFDNALLSNDELRIKDEDIVKAYELINEEQISAIETAKSRVEQFDKTVLKRLSFETKSNGVSICSSTQPIRSVGCYVPGGIASYPSSVVMTVTPAKVAGVPRIAVCSPPQKNNNINPLTIIAADICAADEIYKLGGAQAIAALAYGTNTISPVDKIVGPGNQYVLAAKLQVSNDVETDLPAGPSEVLILADESADPEFIALDMISQAEHGIWGAIILVTVSSNLANKVSNELNNLVQSCPRKELVIKSLSQSGLLLVLKTMKECISFVNEFAPEHLELMIQDAKKVAKEIYSSGLILLGDYTPVSASDYCLGVNHVLPTSGYGHIYSGLSVIDFVKRINIVETSKEGLSKVRDTIKVLARNEGLMNHSLAIEGRFKN